MELSPLFIEEKISGANIKRTGFKTLGNLTKDDCDVLVISELSRISRNENVLPVITLIGDIIGKGIDVAFLSNDKVYKGGETLDMMTLMMLVIEAFGAADERKKINQRMMSGKKSKLASCGNMLVAGNVAFGYKAIDNTDFVQGKTPRTLIAIDEEKAEIVRDVYRRFNKGESINYIARALNAKGEYNTKGNEWTNTTIRELLANPIYKGERKYDGVTYENDAIVTNDDWNKANEVLTENKTKTEGYHKRENVLYGKIFCGYCGEPMYMKTYGKGDKSYTCATKAVASKKANCKNIGIGQEILVDVVSKTIEDLPTAEFTNENKAIIKKAKDEIALLKIEIEGNEKQAEKIDKAIDAYIEKSAEETDKMMSDRMMTLARNKNKELTEVKAKIDQEKAKIAELTHKIEKVKKSKQHFTKEERKQVFNDLLEKVVWYGENSLTGVAEIYLTNGKKEIVCIWKDRKEKVTKSLRMIGDYTLTRNKDGMFVLSGGGALK